MKAANKDILEGKVKNAQRHFKDLGGLGTVAFIFNLIALHDAMQGIKETGLMVSDDFLDVQQKFFACAAAWTGFTTGKAWNAVKGSETLRSHSLSTLRALVSEGENYAHISTKELKYFNRWLAVTASLGAISAGIEAFRVYNKLDQLQGRELGLQYVNFVSLLTQSGSATIQFLGSLTGRLSANFMFGGPIMGILLVATITSILVGISLSKLKKRCIPNVAFRNSLGSRKKPGGME